MNKKSLYGFGTILLAALVAVIATSLYGKTIKLNYIEQIHLQDGYLYYVDRAESENLKIIQSDPMGKHGQMISFQKHAKEQYRIVQEIFLTIRAMLMC